MWIRTNSATAQASAAFDVVRSDEAYPAIFARGRGYLIYWVPTGHDLVLLEWLVWAG